MAHALRAFTIIDPIKRTGETTQVEAQDDGYANVIIGFEREDNAWRVMTVLGIAA